jgi:hypothetical protein
MKALLLAILGACAQQQSGTPLAQLGSPTIEVVSKAQLNVELHFDTSGGCPTLGDDVVALFDGQPMQMTHGGYDVDASGCYPIAFWFNDLPTAAIAGFEKQSSLSQLVIKDTASQWNIESTRLFANDFVNDTANSQIVWFDVTQITSAIVSPAAQTQIDGNTIHYTPGATIDFVDALAHPVPTRCDGPSVCTVNLEGSRDWKGNQN